MSVLDPQIAQIFADGMRPCLAGFGKQQIPVACAVLRLLKRAPICENLPMMLMTTAAVLAAI